MTVTHGETGRFTSVNEEFLKLVGYWRAEVIGSTSEELQLWPEYGDRERVGQVLATEGTVGPISGAVRAKDGQLVPCTTIFRLLRTSSGDCVLSVLIPDGLRPS